MFEQKTDVIRRFNVILFLVFIWGVIIAVSAAFIMLQKDFWNEVASLQVKTNIPLPAVRGNILSDNGEMLVCNHLKYNLFIDFDYTDSNKKIEKKVLATKDTIWDNNVGKLSVELAKIVPMWSAQEYERHLRAGMELQKKRLPRRREYPLFPKNIALSYRQFKQIKQLPILSQPIAYSGLKEKEVKERKKLFGSLAMSTLGDAKESLTDKSNKKVWTTYGLEKKYDNVLKGKDGVGHRIKSRVTVDLHPVHGKDIQTTLNTEMQDICEQALKKKITDHKGIAGWVILMEVKSGDIKAIVNLTNVGEGAYIETYEPTEHNITENHALSRRMEPGSIFKTIAIAAALEDGKLEREDSVLTYGGEHKFYGKRLKDSVTPLEGQEKYGINDVLMHSSNVGMVQLVTDKYVADNNQEQFVETLKEFGMDENYELIVSEVKPSITNIAKVQAKNLTLTTMSYGYSVAMTAINMLTFYNTIANGGDQMAPRLVKAIVNDHEVVETFPTKVLRKNMLSENTVDILTDALISVVNGYSKKRTGKQAQSDKLLIAGKTGTAEVSGVGGYQKQGKFNLYSFCGFFPADKPEYSCIVQVLSHNPGGGGSVAAPVLKEIAEKISAKEMLLPIENAIDTIHPKLPTGKRGNLTAADYIYNRLDITTKENGLISSSNEEPSWGDIEKDENEIITLVAKETKEKLIPNVIGMGAKDALYLMRKAGLKPSISGHGRVVSQSIRAGEKAVRGTCILLTLKP